MVVVFPASMWAMMPMFRVRSSGVWRGISTNLSVHLHRHLPAVMCKCLVGFSHTMSVFALLHRSTSQVGRVQKLVRQLLLHGLAVAALAREADEPPDAERQPTIGIDLHRNLIVRAPTRRDFTSRLGFTFSTAFLKIFSGSSPVRSLMMSKLSYMIRSARLRLPSDITVLMNLLTSVLL